MEVEACQEVEVGGGREGQRRRRDGEECSSPLSSSSRSKLAKTLPAMPNLDIYLNVIKWRKSHSLEMTAISLLSPHGEPHRTPLRVINRLNDSRYFVHESNGKMYTLIIPKLAVAHITVILDNFADVFGR